MTPRKLKTKLNPEFYRKYIDCTNVLNEPSWKHLSRKFSLAAI